jgi:hypothetical protein
MNDKQKAANLERPTAQQQHEGKAHKTQLQTIFLYLQDHVATASMVTNATGIPQKCITRYKRDLEKNGMLWEVERKYCQLTGFKAYYLTTDPAKAPKSKPQLNLF